MEDANVEQLVTLLKESFMDSVEKIQDHDLEDFKHIIETISRNISLSLLTDEVETLLSGIDLGVDNICGQFGSPTSRDMDFFVVLSEPKPKVFLDAVREYYKLWISGMFQARMMEYTGVDIQFITVDSEGVVDWAEKGNITEINNAIFHTYKYHSINMIHRLGEYRECPVKREVPQEIGIKALKTVRSLITFLSRTEYRDVCKRLLFEESLSGRTEAIKQLIATNGLISSLESFEKPKHSDEDILKSITFSFIQLAALVDKHPVPFTKNAALSTPSPEGNDHWEFAPIILNYTSDYISDTRETKIALDALIYYVLDRVSELITYENDGVVGLEGDEHVYLVRKEEPYNMNLY